MFNIYWRKGSWFSMRFINVYLVRADIAKFYIPWSLFIGCLIVLLAKFRLNLCALLRSVVKPQTSISLDGHVNQPLSEFYGGFLHAYIWHNYNKSVSSLLLCTQRWWKYILALSFHHMCHSGAPLPDSSCHRAKENYRTGTTLMELRKSVLILMAYRAGGGGGLSITYTFTNLHVNSGEGG